MKTNIINIEKKALAVQAISKMIADKEAVKAYVKGERDLESLTKRGIKFAKSM